MRALIDICIGRHHHELEDDLECEAGEDEVLQDDQAQLCWEVERHVVGACEAGVSDYKQHVSVVGLKETPFWIKEKVVFPVLSRLLNLVTFVLLVAFSVIV